MNPEYKKFTLSFNTDGFNVEKVKAICDQIKEDGIFQIVNGRMSEFYIHMNFSCEIGFRLGDLYTYLRKYVPNLPHLAHISLD